MGGVGLASKVTWFSSCCTCLRVFRLRLTTRNRTCENRGVTNDTIVPGEPHAGRLPCEGCSGRANQVFVLRMLVAFRNPFFSVFLHSISSFQCPLNRELKKGFEVKVKCVVFEAALSNSPAPPLSKATPPTGSHVHRAEAPARLHSAQ